MSKSIRFTIVRTYHNNAPMEGILNDAKELIEELSSNGEYVEYIENDLSENQNEDGIFMEDKDITEQLKDYQSKLMEEAAE